MATMLVSNGVLSIRFTPSEKVWGLVRDVDVPVQAIGSITAVADGLSAPRGIRAPGLGMPGRRKIGTWRGHGDKTLVSVSRDQPAVEIRPVDGAGLGYTRIVIGSDQAVAQAASWSTLVSPGRASGR